ncbi:hypothetical protein FPCIR_7731 [Fusarium pseudocircinatum]|uniref:Ecp2 effector protein domain-containing protein n=1 Tax=Fusarium pseudocircinatum TaxID=56676 RepID=A0A8H5L919_9HYPO|nr:hypothetical protein FPCIR_7731 [Fusarium pseudocircinatum]
MQSSILFLSSAMALISQATAGVMSPHEASLAHFQIFGDDSCTTAESMGDFNLYSEDTDKCHTFPTDKPVNSVYISYINDECAIYPQTGDISAESLTKSWREGLEPRLAVNNNRLGLKHCRWLYLDISTENVTVFDSDVVIFGALVTDKFARLLEAFGTERGCHALLAQRFDHFNTR